MQKRFLLKAGKDGESDIQSAFGLISTTNVSLYCGHRFTDRVFNLQPLQRFLLLVALLRPR